MRIQSIPVPDRRALAVLLVMYVASRVIYALLGLSFDASGLVWYWQFLDPELLRGDLLKSVYLLHTQPPLFNLFLGTILKLSGSHSNVLYHICFILVSIVAFVSMYFVFRKFNTSVAPAAILTSLYIASPTSAVYENWLFYTWPVAAMIILSVVLLWMMLSRPSKISAIAFFGLLCTISLTRSLYPMTFVVAVFLFGLLLLPRHKSDLTIGFLIPIALVFGWNLKNKIVFDEFTASTWSGMGLAKIVDASLEQRTQGMLDSTSAGDVRSLADVPPFSTPEVYERILEMPARVGHPALDDERKSTGHPNYNHAVYLEASPLYRREALASIRSHPGRYARQVVKGLFLFSRPTTSYFMVTPLSNRLGCLNAPYDTILYGNIAWFRFGSGVLDRQLPPFYQIGWLVLIALALVLYRTLQLGWRMVKSQQERTNENIMFIYMSCIIFYTTIVCCMVEYGENERFKLNIEMLLYILFIVSVISIKNDNFARKRRQVS